MGLFFEVLSAINNPGQQASVEGLSQIMGSVSELAKSQGVESDAMQQVMSSVGSVLRPALKQQQTLGNLGGGGLGNLLGQLAGSTSSAGALSSLLSPQLQQQMIEGITQQTGLDASKLQGMLPSLVPVVLNMLNLGSTQPGGTGGNSLLNTFLDSERDGDVDLGDVFKFANRFLNPPADLGNR